MPASHRTPPIDADEATLRTHLEHAELPALLVTLAHLTGDDAILRDELRPDGSFMAGPQGGYSEHQLSVARKLCLDALSRYRDAGCPPPTRPTETQIRGWLGFLVGDIDLESYLPLLLSELALDGPAARAPQWRKAEVAPDRDFRVAIIGAGMSGLAAAFRLQQAGVPFVIFEKSDDVAGTWHDNVYPGCRVDVPNHFYSYSFAQKADWPQIFSTQDALLDYFRQCADEFDLRRHVRFATEVTEAVFDEEAGSWTLALRGPDGAESFEAQALISAVGQLNRPNMPEIEGMESFEGPSFHSARWQHDVPLEGKRVAIIGTGASACQFIPRVADVASELTVFQRTAPWLLPTPEYHDPVPEGLQWLFTHVPFYAAWYRFWLFWTGSEGLLGSVVVEDDWGDPKRSVSEANDLVRVMLTEYLAEQCGDDKDLLEKMTPDYPPFSKRFVRDNGILPATYQRDHVSLDTAGIERITPSGIRTADGREIEVDVILYGTGFTASDFLMPMKIVGRGGCELHDVWDGDARAYLGITLPHFPNLFLMYGPNTNIVVNGSIIYFSECEVDYILACVRKLLGGGHKAMDCRPEVHDAYNERIDAENLRKAWGAATVNTWYRNRHGRISQNWPYTLLAYYQQTREVAEGDYEIW